MKLPNLKGLPKLSPKDNLTEDETEAGLKWFIRDGLATQIMYTMTGGMITVTGGVFLIDFALNLGASNSLIGILAAIPFLTQLLQIPSIYLIKRLQNRKKICIGAVSSERVFWLVVASIPFVFSKEIGLKILIMALFVSASFGAVAGCSWNSWIRDLVPQDRLGSFFSTRLRLALGACIPLSLVAAFYIDYWKRIHPDDAIYGYSPLFFLGFIAGISSVYFISRATEPCMLSPEKMPKFSDMLSQPLKDTNFRNLILFLASMNFAVYLSAPFFTVYMLKVLNLPMTYVMSLTVLNQLSNLIFLRIWGELSDRFSNKSVLAVSIPIFMICLLGWTFTTMPEKHALTIPLLVLIHIFVGISMAGIILSSVNIALKLAPRENATSYLAANSLIYSLATGIAPIFGGRLADMLSESELSWTLELTGLGKDLSLQTLNLQEWDFLFAISILAGLFSLYRLAIVKDVGEVDERVILEEITNEVTMMMRNFSSAARIFRIAQFPISGISKILGIKEDRIIVQGTEIFPGQIESVMKGIPEVGDSYQIVVDRRRQQDFLTIQIEMTESTVSDRIKNMVNLSKKVSREFRDVLNVKVDVVFVESSTIPRSRGKIHRIIDRRKV